MSRASVLLRTALPSDATALRELWSDVLRPTTREEQVADVLAILEAAEGDPDTRVVVAEIDGQVVGAVHLRAGVVSTLNLERMVQAFAPHVMPGHHRRGVGSALMEAATAFAEERGIGLVGAAALSASRDANRFFARLSMGPVAVLRVASTVGLRQRLPGVRPARSAGSPSNRHIDKVLAARRGRRQARVSS
ncbi:GNAT family N-acetyltransferase [Nocardioides sp. Y6]|uniref:GNAT family N-acetyltransferase n=1 Tax=Nocardioides malaquae TaxID=2773426 RepID=A0ABR9RNP1_9ACTN|nr:GNAT family N-acetyltransferase [Nocardioides malaquae]MBE7323184.1 GNAT family N-acetyltransferase [Nocardioides malaquae]